jgi:hypothetical protein
MPVGAGEKGSNPHAPFSPALAVKAKSQKQRKNPGTPPLANRYIHSQNKAPWGDGRSMPTPSRATFKHSELSHGGTTGYPHPPRRPLPPLNPPTPGAPPRNSILLNPGGKGRSQGGCGLGKPKTLRSAVAGRTMPAPSRLTFKNSVLCPTAGVNKSPLPIPAQQSK